MSIDADTIMICTRNQDRVVVEQLVENDRMSKEQAENIWIKSKTRNAVQKQYKLYHFSGMRCYGELLLELKNDPQWMMDTFD